MPQVSIITPTYNCARFIAQTIESVQAQTFTDWEMIISDDCSTDDTLKVIEPYLNSDARIKYICNDKNSGAAITRNNALRVAQGRWIAFLDSDDLWLPAKLEQQIAFMESNDYAFSYHEYEEISEAGEPLGVIVSGKRRVGKFDMFACCWPGCLAVMYDTTRIGLIQINDVRKNNDTAMWLKVVRKADCYLLKSNLARYRRRQGSITPPSIKERILWHYRLFRDAEQMGVVGSAFWMCVNIVGNLYKKIFFVHKL